MQVFFSSPEPKARVSYCHSAPSVVRLSKIFPIYNLFSETAERNSTKLDRKQDLNTLYQVCVFRACQKGGTLYSGAQYVALLASCLCIYLGEGRGRGVALMHLYVWEHIVIPNYRTAWRMFTKLGRDEELMAPTCIKVFQPETTQGRIQDRAKIGHGGFLLPETSSSDQKATATNRMYNNDLEACGMKCCYFFVPFWSQIFYAFIVLRWATVALWASCLHKSSRS